MSILTISRQVGSGGDAIARKTSEILGWTYFDKQVLQNAAKEAGIVHQHVIDFNEDSYPVKDFWSRLIGSEDKIGLAKVEGMDKDGTLVLSTEYLDEEECLSFIQSTLYYLEDHSNTVLVGRGGQALFHEHPHAFHVRIIAPLEKRLEEVIKATALPKEKALEFLKQRDTAAAQYIKRFYNKNWDDQLLYHLTINTGLIDDDTASLLLADAVRNYFSQSVQK